MANLGFPMDGRQPPYFVNLVGSPLPLPPSPRSTNSYTSISTHLLNCYSRIPVDSILLAVLTVSPNKQYLGIVNPTTPVGGRRKHHLATPKNQQN